MSNYTAEDFAQATLAVRSLHGLARRVSPESDKQWRASWIPDFAWLSDAEMAEQGWTPIVEARQITLDSLAAAWEAAEVPTDDNPVREGDVCLVFLGATWIAGEVGDRWWPVGDARILSRAPREPWQDLANVIEAAYQDTGWSESYDDLASALHKRGVRVTGGDDDE